MSELLREHIDDERLLDLLNQYIRRVVVEDGLYENVTKGISLGCALSPIIGALYLNRLDERMESSGFFTPGIWTISQISPETIFQDGHES